MLQRHNQQHFWNFLRNKEMNEIYLSYGIINFALGLVSVFVPIYLYKLGFSLMQILFYYFLLPLNSIILTRYFAAPLVIKVGVKRSIIYSVIFKIIFFVGLQLLPGSGWLIFILPTLHVLKTQIGALSYHFNYLEHSDAKKRGRQVSAMFSTALFAGLLAPLCGGLIIGLAGFNVLFTLAIVLMMVSVIPILFLPNKKTVETIKFDTHGMWREMFCKVNIPLFVSYGGYAIEEWIGTIVWSLFIFFMFNSTTKLGAINTIVATITFFVFYFVGRMSDKKDKKKLIKFVNFFYFFGWVGRIFADNFSAVVFVDSYKNITGNMLQVPWTAFSYDLAAKRNYFRFIVEREIMFDIARAIFVPLVLLVFLIGYKPFVLSFILAAVCSLGYMAIDRFKEV